MKKPGSPAPARGNALLDRFPADVRKRLDETQETHRTHDVLFEADERPKWAHFPHFGMVVSLTRTTESGATIEVGVIGSEGVATVQALLLPQPSGNDAVVQMAGTLSRVRMDLLRAAMNDNAVVRETILTFAGVFMNHISQHATCNRVHTIEQRLAKWLLFIRDRTDRDEMELTHDFLSHMLGTRRAGATIAVGSLALDGLIEQHRGGVKILDRQGLEERACECYGAVRDMTFGLHSR
jgi:CRP-like cAMP-binding protein